MIIWTVAGGLEKSDGYLGTGSWGSVASGRISYALGLQGPSLTVDTACSSSLVATHLACQSLRQGECSMALVGGVKLMLTPGVFVDFSRLRGLARGRSLQDVLGTADGTGWSEGCGMVVLERLADARRNGRRILAVIRGSAVNQDGRSNGLTAPNGPSQQAVIRRALTEAAVKPSEVGYVECHGTGTRLGDPIEVQALGAVLGEGRAADRPVAIGSLKSNLGHTQAAAGVGGLIKVVLSLQHGQIPKNLHFAAPSPHIPWDELAVQVVSEPMAWARNGVARIAGVSSFGVSGTNAHVIVEEAPADAEEPAQAPSPRSAELMVVSARSAEALDACVSRLGDHVKAHPEQTLRDIAYSLAATRSHHEHRLALAVGTRAELLSGLEAASRDETWEGLSRGQASQERRKVVFVFPGQGSQWLGMGRELLAEEPAFCAALEECSAAIETEAGWSVIEELNRVGSESRLDSIEVVQPTLFALEVALAALWRSWGLKPDVVVGHSMGEVAAAYVSGALTLPDAAKVICRRSALLKRIQGKGEMALVQLPADEAVAALSGNEALLSVAVSNSRRSTVLSGEPAALERVLSQLEARGIFCRRVKVDVASHSPQVDVLREDLLSALADVSPQPPALAMRSTVSGRAIGEGELNAAYWVDNLRKPVRLADVVEDLLREGYGTFVEMSPHPILLPALEELCGETGTDATVVGSLFRNRPERAAMLASLGKLHVHGCGLHVEGVFPSGGRRVELPNYPWQRKRYWVEASAAQQRSGQATGYPVMEEPASVRDGVGEESGLYQFGWSVSSSPQASAPSGRWLVVAREGDEVAAGIVAELRARGADCVCVDLAGLRAALPAEHVVCLWRRLGDEPGVEAACRLAGEGLEIVQVLAQQQQAARLWWVTHGAVAVTAQEPANVAQASLWGLGRTVMQEHPELECTLIDIADGPNVVGQLLGEFTAGDAERQIAWRNGERRVARLVRAVESHASQPLFRLDGTVLVTGGLGVLGLNLARWFAARGAKHLLLTGRRGHQTPGAAEAVAALEAFGARVTVAAVDVSDGVAVRALLAAIPSDLPLRGVVHTAGVLDDGVLSEQSVERLARVIAPKVGGACHLDELTRGADLDFFVLFSSVAGTLGSAGQGGYAAANACLDALASRRRAAGLCATSLAWGLWVDASSKAAGLASGLDSAQQARLEKSGLGVIDPSQGLALFEASLGRSEAQLMPVPIDLAQLRKSFGDAVPSLWRELIRAPRRTPPASARRGAWARELSLLPQERRLEAAIAAVRGEVARVLSLEGAEAVASERPLKELGLNSLMALELRNALGKLAGTTLPATLAFDYPTPAAIAKYLMTTILKQAVVTNTPKAMRESEDIVATKLNEAAIELTNLFHRQSPTRHPASLDSATRASIEEFARAFTQRLIGLKNSREIYAPVCLRSVPKPRMRLFCFPYAGGRAESFEKWTPYLSEGIDLHAFSYPEAAATVDSVEAYVSGVATSIANYADLPYAIIGHSLGSMFAWRVTSVLTEQGIPVPKLLVTSGCAAPSVFKTMLLDRLRDTPPEELMALISGARMSAREIPRDLVEIFARDLQLAMHLPITGTPIAVPILTLIGDTDALIHPQHVEPWRHVTSAKVDIEIVPGDHHYWFNEASCERLVALIAHHLALDNVRTQASTWKSRTLAPQYAID